MLAKLRPATAVPEDSSPVSAVRPIRPCDRTDVPTLPKVPLGPTALLPLESGMPAGELKPPLPAECVVEAVDESLPLCAASADISACTFAACVQEAGASPLSLSEPSKDGCEGSGLPDGALCTSRGVTPTFAEASQFWAAAGRTLAPPRLSTYTTAESEEVDRYLTELAQLPISVQLLVQEGPDGPRVELEVYYEAPAIIRVDTPVKRQEASCLVGGGKHCVDYRLMRAYTSATISFDQEESEELDCEDVYAMYSAYASAVDYTHYGSLLFNVVESGGEPYVEVEIYYEQMSLDDFSHSTGGVASALAAAAGLSRESLPASAVPPDEECCKPTVRPNPSNAGEVLEDLEWGKPHWYYRFVAYLAAWLLILFAASLQFMGDLISVVIPLTHVGVWWYYARVWWLNKWWGRLLAWVEDQAEPPPPFVEPKPYRTASRTRRQGRYTWGGDYMYRLSKGKYLTSRLLRNARRYDEAKQQFEQIYGGSAESAAFAQRSIHLGVGCTFRGLIPLMLVLCVCLLATVGATPELLEGTRVITTSLAAWELSRLARWDFRPRILV